MARIAVVITVVSMACNHGLISHVYDTYHKYNRLMQLIDMYILFIL